MIEAFDTHRSLMFGIAYRMLGRVSEAEDVLQEVWLRWQKQDPAQVRSAKAWLVSATTRRCIDQLRSARREREQYYGVWLPEPLMPRDDADGGQAAELADSLTVAFMMLLESLGPEARAVFLLREVFGYDYPEVAGIVGKSEAACRQSVRRAKAQLQGRPQTVSEPTELARRLVEEFLAAVNTGEVEPVLSLLSEDSHLYSDGGGRVKAAGLPILGADRVSRFMLGVWPRFGALLERRRVDINGAPGLLMSLDGQVHYAISFEVARGRIQNIYISCNPEKLRHLARQEAG